MHVFIGGRIELKLVELFIHISGNNLHDNNLLQFFFQGDLLLGISYLLCIFGMNCACA